MEYKKIILECYDLLAKTYLEIGKLNQEIKKNTNSKRMIIIHGYSSVRALLSEITNTNIEMGGGIETSYQQWINAQKHSNDIYVEKKLILDPLVKWKTNETAKKYYQVNENGNIFDILDSLANYKDPLIKGAVFYAKMLSELPFECVSSVFAENHLASILSNVIDMPFYPLRASIKENTKKAITEYKNGSVVTWINYFLNLILYQINSNLLLLSNIDNYLVNLKAKMKNAGVSHLKIDQFSNLLIDNSFVDAKFISKEISIVPYRAKLALDLMNEKGILLKSDTKRNTTYILIDYYRKFLTN